MNSIGENWFTVIISKDNVKKDCSACKMWQRNFARRNAALTASIIDDNRFWKIHCFTFFLYKSIRDQIWPCRKIGQGQPRVIIWANLVVPEHPMLHTMFQSHRPFGPRKEDFLRFLPYMGMVAILVMWPGPFEQTFVPPAHRSSIWNLTLIVPVVSEEKMFKQCGRWRRKTEAYLSYKLISKPSAQVS